MGGICLSSPFPLPPRWASVMLCHAWNAFSTALATISRRPHPLHAPPCTKAKYMHQYRIHGDLNRTSVRSVRQIPGSQRRQGDARHQRGRVLRDGRAGRGYARDDQRRRQLGDGEGAGLARGCGQEAGGRSRVSGSKPTRESL